MAAKKQWKDTVYVIKNYPAYLLYDGRKFVGAAGSKVTAADEAKRLGYDDVKEVTLEQWLELILSSE